MYQAPGSNRFFRRLVPTVAVGILLVCPGVAGAAAVSKHQGPLSPDLRTLGQPSVSTQSEAQQAAILGLPESGPGSLIRFGSRVLLEVSFDQGAVAGSEDLRDAGAAVISTSGRYQAVTVAALPASVFSIATVPGVRSVKPVPAPMVLASCEGGSVISEGVAQTNAKAARDAFGLNGQGVTVGVLSDSFDRGDGVATDAGEDVETEDLPGLANECLDQKIPVDVHQELSPTEEGTDEGRAMLQIVHDVAPAAKLAFASAFLGEPAFADSVEELAAPVLAGGAGAKVIVDDVVYFEEPFFQDGPVAAAVNKVTAEGVTYLSAAGNDNLVDSAGRDIASWEAPAFRDAGQCPAAVQALGSEVNPSHCMDFAPEVGSDTTFGITVEPKGTLRLSLQWAEPWFGVSTDIDAFLLNGGGTALLDEALDDNISTTEKPVELLSWTNGSNSSRTVQLAINRFAGGDPRLKFALLQNGGGVSATEYPESKGGDVVGPTVFGHAGSAAAIAVGAVPFNNATKPERYSSRGPVTHYFDQVSGTTPAPALGSGQVIPKPDLVATDCGRTTFFAFEPASEPGVWRFCGTSAAAPHAAGAVALMMQKAEAEGGGLDEPEPIRSALLKSASPVGAFNACAVGAGLVETRGAVEALVAGPGSAPSLACAAPPPPSSQGGVTPPLIEPTESSTPNPFEEMGPLPGDNPPPVAPATRILRHPPKLVRTRGKTARVVFRFGSDQPVGGFLCKFDRAAFRACGSRIARRFRVGPRAVRVKAVSSAGLADSTPAVFRFRVERIP
jgi:Subtilase family